MKVLMKGNEAIAQAAISAGCRLFFGYPITPQTEISAYMAKQMPKVGGTYLQAESEVAAINMVLGATASGARAMTSSSSPGISLKAEGISYIAASDLPAVIANVQRAGPGLGGIQPSQADYWQATKALGHGDFHVLVYAPATVQEMMDFTRLAFDKAEEYRMPAMILADGMLGQMMEPVTLPEDRQPKTESPSWSASGHRDKRKHNIINSLYLIAHELEELILERYKRYAIIEEQEQQAEEYLVDDAELIVVAYGASARVARGAIQAAREQGIRVGMVRPITLWPFPKKSLQKAAEKTEQFLVVEMSTGQMIDDVRLATECRIPVAFCGRTGGMIPSPIDVLASIKSLTQKRGVCCQ